MKKFIVEAKFANGDDYADKVDTVDEVVAILRNIDMQDGYYAPGEKMPDNQRIDINTIHIYTEDQDTGELSYKLK